jgi:hypothetical protein
MPAQWRIEYWPSCEAHIFLSHCAEDRERLILPVYEELKCRHVIPWIDRHDYPAGRDAMEALREELLKCRHVIYFVTDAMLRQGRGWASAERAFAATIQQRLRYFDAEIAHIELPLIFVPVDDPVLQRSVWRGLADKAKCCPHPMPRRGSLGRTSSRSQQLQRWREEHVQWAAATIESFVRQEERWAVEVGIRLEQDSRLRDEFRGDANLTRRILAQAPRPSSTV